MPADEPAFAATEPGRGSATEPGGERGIRTLGTLSRTHAFQACALSRSAISPAPNSPQRAAAHTTPCAPRKPKLSVHLQRRQECRLRDLHLPELPHPLLAFLLLLQQLPLPRDIATV